jgi:thiol-disulfide isomerase/thioredoxin
MPSDATLRRWATGIVVGSVATLAVTGLALYVSAGRLSAPAYATNQRVDLPASLYEGAERTLLLVARSSCGGCQAAKPFLTQLVTAARRVPGTRVSLIVPRLSTTENVFASEMGFSPAEVVALDVSRFNLRLVPTILVVDGSGIIRFVHESPPGADQQAGLLTKYEDALKRP